MVSKFSLRQDSQCELPQTTALDAWGMHLISSVVWGSALVESRENQRANGSILEVFWGAFLLRMEGMPGSPWRSNGAGIYPRKSKYRGRVVKTKQNKIEQ